MQVGQTVTKTIAHGSYIFKLTVRREQHEFFENVKNPDDDGCGYFAEFSVLEGESSLCALSYPTKYFARLVSWLPTISNNPEVKAICEDASGTLYRFASQILADPAFF